MTSDFSLTDSLLEISSPLSLVLGTNAESKTHGTTIFKEWYRVDRRDLGAQAAQVGVLSATQTVHQVPTTILPFNYRQTICAPSASANMKTLTLQHWLFVSSKLSLHLIACIVAAAMLRTTVSHFQVSRSEA
jgi:hypothetical protein